VTGFRDGRLIEGGQGPPVLPDVHRHREQGGAPHVQVPPPSAAVTATARIPGMHLGGSLFFWLLDLEEEAPRSSSQKKRVWGRLPPPQRASLNVTVWGDSGLYHLTLCDGSGVGPLPFGCWGRKR